MDNLWIVILTSLLSGLIGVIVTLSVQKRAAKRNEQMLVFKTLMGLRFVGVSYEKTRALNLIDMTFYDVESVTSAWRNLHTIYGKQDPTPEEVQDGTIKLLESMAKYLNYKNLNWEIIKKDYLPIGISNDMRGEAEYKDLQLKTLRAVEQSGILQSFLAQAGSGVNQNHQR